MRLIKYTFDLSLSDESSEKIFKLIVYKYIRLDNKVV